MALQKSIELNGTGIMIEYHKVCPATIVIDPNTKGGRAKVNIYKDAAARTANKNPVTNKMYSIPANTFSTLNLSTTDSRSLVYAYLKTLPEYTGAVDV